MLAALKPGHPWRPPEQGAVSACETTCDGHPRGWPAFFALAIGYATLFWPEFKRVNGYLLRKGATPENVRSFAQQPGATRQSVVWVMNHVHLLDVHTGPVDDASSDKLIVLGNVLADIYRAKLAWQFPDKPCEVEFFVPEDREELWE